MKNPVGPVLRMGDEVDQVIAAIEDDNPDTDIDVIDRGAYVRVQGEDQITVTQDTLRRYLGADYEIRSFGGAQCSLNQTSSATGSAAPSRSRGSARRPEAINTAAKNAATSMAPSFLVYPQSPATSFSRGTAARISSGVRSLRCSLA